MRLRVMLTFLGCVALGLATLAQTAKPSTYTLPLRMTSWAVNMSNIAPGGTQTVDIVINRWSTEAERQSLIKVFFEKGANKLLDAVQDAKPVGYIRVPTRISYDLRFARQFPLDDGGARFVILTDRPVDYWEARNQPRTIDYPFTLIELRLGRDGKGEGKLALATKIVHNKKDNVVELENYSSEPVRLTNLKLEQSSR